MFLSRSRKEVELKEIHYRMSTENQVEKVPKKARCKKKEDDGQKYPIQTREPLTRTVKTYVTRSAETTSLPTIGILSITINIFSSLKILFIPCDFYYNNTKNIRTRVNVVKRSLQKCEDALIWSQPTSRSTLTINIWSNAATWPSGRVHLWWSLWMLSILEENHSLRFRTSSGRGLPRSFCNAALKAAKALGYAGDSTLSEAGLNIVSFVRVLTETR